MKTFSLKPADVDKKWLLIDAKDLVLGRLASFIATRLRGKHKPVYTPHVDCGDNVIVINAEKVYLTGKKRDDKTYYRHSGYPGGIKSTTADEIYNSKFPERLVMKAVKRMLPSGALANQQLTHLRIFKGPEHPHAGQNPITIDFGKLNDKNKRRN